MAKAKKKGNLTLEEKLKQALVPVEEQPYEVPRNWCWVKLNSINQFESFVVEPMKRSNEKFELYSVPSSENNYPEILLGNEIGSAKQLVKKNDILLCKINPRINRVWYVKGYTNNCLLASSEWIVIRNRMLNEKYLMWCMRAKYFREYMLSNVSGVGGSLMRAQPKYVKLYPIPLPPLPEQQRIVDQIERLFFKLDKAKEKVQGVIDDFESRKAAILHKAFTGELTAKWRKEHGVRLDSWENRTLESVCASIFDGDHMPPPKTDSGIPFLVISNVNTGHLSYENTRYVSKEYYDSLSETRRPEVGDVLYTLVGSYGIPVIVDDERPFCFQRHIALLKLNDLNTFFMWYLLQSQEMYDKATSIATGTAQLTVPIKGLRKIEFMRPSDDEQTEIVHILDDLLIKEQQAKKTAEAVLGQIETIKKSILTRAFRGELGTSEPSEESAVELLKTILDT